MGSNTSGHTRTRSRQSWVPGPQSQVPVPVLGRFLGLLGPVPGPVPAGTGPATGPGTGPRTGFWLPKSNLKPQNQNPRTGPGPGNPLFVLSGVSPGTIIDPNHFQLHSTPVPSAGGWDGEAEGRRIYGGSFSPTVAWHGFCEHHLYCGTLQKGTPPMHSLAAVPTIMVPYVSRFGGVKHHRLGQFEASSLLGSCYGKCGEP